MPEFSKENAAEMAHKRWEKHRNKQSVKTQDTIGAITEQLGFSSETVPPTTALLIESAVNGNGSALTQLIRLVGGSEKTFDIKKFAPKEGEICSCCGVRFLDDRLKVETIRGILDKTGGSYHDMLLPTDD